MSTANAREGFGQYVGFTSAWGYWISAWVGNVAYLVLLMSTLGYWFPSFEGGTTVAAIAGASLLLGVVHVLTSAVSVTPRSPTSLSRSPRLFRS